MCSVFLGVLETTFPPDVILLNKDAFLFYKEFNYHLFLFLFQWKMQGPDNIFRTL